MTAIIDMIHMIIIDSMYFSSIVELKIFLD